jgi:hypothetical protein
MECVSAFPLPRFPGVCCLSRPITARIRRWHLLTREGRCGLPCPNLWRMSPSFRTEASQLILRLMNWSPVLVFTVRHSSLRNGQTKGRHPRSSPTSLDSLIKAGVSARLGDYWPITANPECTRLNRHVVGGESPLRKGSSESILTWRLAGAIVTVLMFALAMVFLRGYCDASMSA